MEQFVQIVVSGTVVGFLFFYIPLVWDHLQLLGFARYVNFDLITLMQLETNGGPRALAYPLSKKLSEYGMLLSWRTQRTLEALQGEDALDPQDMANLVRTLTEHREAVGLLGEHAGVMAWDPRGALDSARTPKARKAADGIRRDWKLFRHNALFLRSFLMRRAGP